MNYHNEMLNIISSLKGRKPKLLLHSCCGPCSTTVLEFLVNYFDITVYYYNPNIEPIEEYEKRKNEQIRYIQELNNKNIRFLDGDYENTEYRLKVKGLEKEKEGGARCVICFNLRLEKTAIKAKELKCEYFATTLTVSPHKNSKIINELGKKIEEKHGIKFLVSDFKKKDGYKNSILISKKYNLYRQDYCGCEFGRVQNDRSN